VESLTADGHCTWISSRYCAVGTTGSECTADWWPHHYSPSVRTSSFFFPAYGFGFGYGGSSLFSLMLFAFAAYSLFSVLQRMQGDEVDYDEDYQSERSSVCKVQVGLLGLARSLQTDLDSIARRSDTSSPQGLHYLLQETLLALNRNPDYCVYGAAEVKRARNIERAETGFNAMSMKERGKIKEETLSNWEGRKSERSVTLEKQGVTNELIVVTILVATVGTLKLPSVRSRNELKEALNKLGSVRARDVLAVEVLWTPQDKDDSFTPEELMIDYPELCAL